MPESCLTIPDIMASSTSFGAHRTKRPFNYRTPSPPRTAIEPLSPRSPFRETASIPQYKHSKKAKISDRGQEYEANRRPNPGTDENQSCKAGGHARSRSTIDTLATIALATSPTFSPHAYPSSSDMIVSPPANNATPDILERPSKRARSEKAPSPSWQKVGSRPATSHASTLDSMKTDAELLLNFARPNNVTYPSYDNPKKNFDNTTQWYNPELGRDTTSISSLNRKEDMSFEPLSRGWAGSSNGASIARLRSRSDGSEAISRPKSYGFIPDDPFYRYSMESALEDDQVVVNEESKVIVNSAPNISKSQFSSQSEMGFAKAEPRKQDIGRNSPSQTKCAACNLDRAPVDTGENDANVTWVNCDGCGRWFHIVCAGFKNDREIRTVDKFICRQCRPVHGPTTFVRKSTRPRTAIDYAGLNQGFVKPPTEQNEHHYIKLIKEGKIPFLQDNFARIRPELVTSTYLERGIGMTEPIIVPAHLNPHTPTSTLESADQVAPRGEVATQEEFDEIIDNLENGYLEEAVDCGQDSLDMVLPDNLTVKAVGDIYGPEEKIEVIDVKSQQGEEKRWSMQKWVDYYYDSNNSKTVRNVISLEVSQCGLGRLIRRPRIVRELDLQDSVWPRELLSIGDYPKIQFYCLMSVADCYTDFHIDFGGSSVYYHILKGRKTFFFIPPKEKHLKKYEEWCNSASQDAIFLGNETKECYRVDLSAGDTMLIPAGWIHAVWTPEDSLVIGGNFLTRVNYGMQIKISKIEKDTKVPRKFRYPHFQKIMWYTVMQYLDEDPVPYGVRESFTRDETYRFYRSCPIYYEMDDDIVNQEPGSEYYNSRPYSEGEINGCPELAKYILRTALIAGGYKVDGVTKDTRNAVSRSIPKGQGDPVEIARTFGIWVAWKKGNETAPQWTRPGAISFDAKVDMSDRRRNTRPSRRSERSLNGNQRQKPNLSTPQSAFDSVSQKSPEVTSENVPVPSSNGTPVQESQKAALLGPKDPADGSPRQNVRVAGLGPKRVACDVCRKRRIKCRHKVESNIDTPLSRVEPTDGLNRAGLEFSSAAQTDVPATAQLIVQEHSSLATQGNEDVRSRETDVLFTDGNTISHNKFYDTGPNSPTNGKKGRVKACDECRKSKRRCIHDEAGRIDPIKIQDRLKKKVVEARRPNFDDEKSSPPKIWAITEPNKAYHSQGEAALTTETDLAGESEKRHAMSESLKIDFSDKRTSYFSPPAVKSELDTTTDIQTTPAVVAPVSSLVSPPTSLADYVDGGLSHDDGEKRKPSDSERNGDHTISIHTPSSISHQPSRYPPAPVSTITNDLSTVPKDRGGTSINSYAPVPVSNKSSPRPSSSSHRGSEGVSVSSIRENKHHNLEDGSIGLKNQSRNNNPTSTQRQGKGAKRDHSTFAEADADEDSIKLIRQLQEEDFGLRRRARRS